jgi:hypothetical protein
LPVDGEVSCLSCFNKRLNRQDLNCWRCGGMNLDRDGVQEALARAEPGEPEWLPNVAADESDRYWVGKWQPDDNPIHNNSCLCPKHKGEGYETPWVITPQMENYVCCADGFCGFCPGYIKDGRWVYRT